MFRRSDIYLPAISGGTMRCHSLVSILLGLWQVPHILYHKYHIRITQIYVSLTNWLLGITTPWLWGCDNTLVRMCSDAPVAMITSQLWLTFRIIEADEMPLLISLDVNCCSKSHQNSLSVVVNDSRSSNALESVERNCRYYMMNRRYCCMYMDYSRVHRLCSVFSSNSIQSEPFPNLLIFRSEILFVIFI